LRTSTVAIVAAALAASAVAFVVVRAETASHFVVHPLVSDEVIAHVTHDPGLMNAWGLAASEAGPWWVANEARSTSTIYAGDGQKQLLTVDVPGGPTGVVYNGGSGFVVGHGAHASPARFLYACEDGRIRGWSPNVPHDWSKQAEIAVDDSGQAAIFRGIALAGGHLYVSDFHNARVLVFDKQWGRVRFPRAFVDPAIPAWYAPFNIVAAGGHLFVSYAWRAPVDGNDAPSGGYVDEFDLHGRLIARVGKSGDLDEPWGLALAPKGFGSFGGDLLVANFGSGRIDAFAPNGGGWAPAGHLPVEVPGIWGIAFGTGGMSGPRTTLFYTSGPHGWRGSSETDVHGVLGAIDSA
jgi:uncharacterized protein (TIGR03118 family)